jgi:cytochrome c peroxidase
MMQPLIVRPCGRLVCALATLLVAACGGDSISDPPASPTLDAQLRQAIAPWGVVPIGAVNPQPEALVDLGRSLFFDKILSGNRDVSCATCHDPLSHMTDGLSLGIGTGAVMQGGRRELGAGRHFTPRNSPTLINQGLGVFSVFWDARVTEGFGTSQWRTPAGTSLPSGLSNILAAQAMFPVTNRNEMRGDVGDRDVFGNANELAAIDDAQLSAIWSATMKRVLAVSEYVQKFNAAFPGVQTSALGFEHAANAIAAFETQAFTRTGSPFDRYLARQDNALSDDAKRGGLLFFGRARCSSCHSGPLLGTRNFASVAIPQIGPGTGSSAPLDMGMDQQFPGQTQRFIFRVPALRNVELTAPYMHNGAYATLENVVRHYSNVDKAVRNYDVTQLDPRLRATYHGDAGTIDALLASLDFRLRPPMNFTDQEIGQIVSFLKSLTDPAARDFSGVTPVSVPSGLPVR